MSSEIITSLDVLEEPFRSAVRGLLADLMERRTYFAVTETRRSYERQVELYNAGKSRTMRSLHLVGKAIDVAPVLLYSDSRVQELTWDKAHPSWEILGELADKWELNWGGRWKNFQDFPHLEARA